MHKPKLYEKYIKRILDILLSLFVLVFLSPLFIVVSVLVRTKLGSPILFKQDRPGYKGKVFKLYKFRTMTDEKDADGNLLPMRSGLQDLANGSDLPALMKYRNF